METQLAPLATDAIEQQPVDVQRIALAQKTRGLDLMSMGEVFAKSGLFKDVRSAAQAIVKIQAGLEMGIEPFQAMMGLYIIEGKVVMSAALMAGLIVRSGRYRYRITRIDNTGCEIEFFGHGTDRWESLGSSSFTIEDAKLAGLTGKDNWRRYARNMFFARALSNGARWFCPDVFVGPAYVPDEFNIPVNEEGEVDVDRVDWSRMQHAVIVTERTDWQRQAAQALYPKLEPFVVDQIKAAATDISVSNEKFTEILRTLAAENGVELPAEV